MLRLALLATAIAYANAATTGTVITMYKIVDDTDTDGDVEDAYTVCIETGAAKTTGDATVGAAFNSQATSGTSHIPANTNIGVSSWKMFVKDQCYNLDSAKLPQGAPFAAGEARSLIQQDSDSNAPASVKFVQAATTLIPNLETYELKNCVTATEDSPQLPRVGVQGAAAGFQCADGAAAGSSSSLSTGYQSNDNPATGDAFTAEGWRTANFIEVGQNATSVATAPAHQTCASGDDTADTAGRHFAILEVMPDDNTAHPATDPIIWANLTAAGCYSTDNATIGAYTSYQTMCDLETGDVVYSTYAAHANGFGCMGNGGAAGTSVRLSQTNSSGCTWVSNGVNWTYAAADVATLCATPANGTAAKWFTMYLGLGADGAGTTCDEDYDGATVAENLGSKAVILGVCYTNGAANGDMTGLEGPFSTTTNAGTGDATALTARNDVGLETAGGSYKFLEASSHITLTHYVSPDCSGTGTTLTTDDAQDAAATDWACGADSKLTHGGAGASGNAATKLQTASQYLTVRAWGDSTGTNLLNTAGNCEGKGQMPSGQRVDHFILDQCFQKSATTSYKWKCESGMDSITNATDGDYYPISYEEFTDTACSTVATATYMWFTQTSYNACADDTATSVACVVTDIDDSVEFAKQTVSCGTCDTSTAKSAAACAALSPAGVWTAGTCTNVHGVAGEYGGKCVTKVTNNSAVTNAAQSFEILTNNATWNAICGVPTPAPTTATSTTSGAGKIAATAAAAAAAAALLL